MFNHHGETFLRGFQQDTAPILRISANVEGTDESNHPHKQLNKRWSLVAIWRSVLMALGQTGVVTAGDCGLIISTQLADTKD